MPLLDHFHPPLSIRRHWEGLHSAWASEISRRLNEVLPPRFFAEPHVRVGGVEVDVGTFEEGDEYTSANEGGVGVAVWAPPKPSRVVSLNFEDIELFEVQVLTDREGPQVVAAIELVSPANKDRPAHRQMFAAKCAGYLRHGVSLVIVDVVTNRSGDLHAELLRVLEAERADSLEAELYAGAYRTFTEKGTIRLELWLDDLEIGSPLPRLPLWIAPDRCLPLDLEPTYSAACASLRIV